MTKKHISCPRCGKKNTWIDENAFRPFCSERCKMIDLGKWADETYRIPVEGSKVKDADESVDQDNE